MQSEDGKEWDSIVESMCDGLDDSIKLYIKYSKRPDLSGTDFLLANILISLASLRRESFMLFDHYSKNHNKENEKAL